MVAPTGIFPAQILCEKIVSVLFGTSGAKKNVFASQIKRRWGGFAPAGATKGYAPLDGRSLFEKSDVKIFHQGRVCVVVS